MADQKISELVEAVDLDDNDLIPVVDVSVPQTKRMTKANARNTLFLQTANQFARNQNLGSVTLTITTSAVDLDFETDGNAKLTLTEDVTVNAPTGLVDGRGVMLKVIQDATGGRSLSFNVAYDFAGYDLAVNDAANAETWYLFWTDGTNVYARKIWETQ